MTQPNGEGGAGPEVQLYIDADGFERLRHDPALHRILTLARIVNTIRFAEVAIVTRGPDDSPSATRQSSSAGFYIGALLWEAFQFADRLGKEFRDSPAFREHLVPLLKDPTVRTLRSGILQRLRNQAVYHHDDGVIPAGLGLVRNGDVVLMSTSGETRRDAYYDLADIAVMHFALDGPEDLQEWAAAASEVLQDIVRAAIRFAAAADHLIVEYAKRTGWRVRTAPDENAP